MFMMVSSYTCMAESLNMLPILTQHTHMCSCFFQNPTTSRDMEVAGHTRPDEVMRLLPECHFGFLSHFNFWHEFIIEDLEIHCIEWKAQRQASKGHLPRQTGIHLGDLHAVADGRALTATAFASAWAGPV